MKKGLIIFVTIILLYFLFSSIVFAFTFGKISNAYIIVTCAEVAEDGSFEWEDEDRCFALNVDPFRSLAFLLTARGKKAEDTLTDVELAEFRFVDKDFRSIYTFYVAYDYALENVYIKRQDGWFRLKNSNYLDKIIISSLEHAFGVPETWRVQSLYSLENWAEADLNDLVFRYNAHWGSPNKPSAEHEYRDSDFKNTQPTSIETKDQAIARAAEELGYKEPVGVVFYDETCGYWMVELYDAFCVNEWTDVSEYTDFLHHNVYTVIMDDEGVTLETYQSVSHYKPFLVLVGYWK